MRVVFVPRSVEIQPLFLDLTLSPAGLTRDQRWVRCPGCSCALGKCLRGPGQPGSGNSTLFGSHATGKPK
jgi:hypothetical protein